jgi:hypothetical protein
MAKPRGKRRWTLGSLVFQALITLVGPSSLILLPSTRTI